MEPAGSDIGAIEERGPPPPVGNISDDSLPALINCDVLDADGLLASAPVSLEGLHLQREGPREFIEGALCAVLLRDILRRIEPACEGHRRIVSGGHLRSEHGLHLVFRLHALDQCEHEIEPALVTLWPRDPGQLLKKTLQEIQVGGPERLHKQRHSGRLVRMIWGDCTHAIA